MAVMILTGLLITASLYDIRTMKIPIWLAVVHILAAIISAARDVIMNGTTVKDYSLTITVILLIVAVAVILRLTEADAAGFADGLLMIAVCMVIRAERAILVFGLAFILAGLFAGVLMMMKRAGRKSRIPFIPFLTVGLLICVILTDIGDIQLI